MAVLEGRRHGRRVGRGERSVQMQKKILIFFFVLFIYVTCSTGNQDLLKLNEWSRSERQ